MSIERGISPTPEDLGAESKREKEFDDLTNALSEKSKKAFTEKEAYIRFVEDNAESIETALNEGDAEVLTKIAKELRPFYNNHKGKDLAVGIKTLIERSFDIGMSAENLVVVLRSLDRFFGKPYFVDDEGVREAHQVLKEKAMNVINNPDADRGLLSRLNYVFKNEQKLPESPATDFIRVDYNNEKAQRRIGYLDEYSYEIPVVHCWAVPRNFTKDFLRVYDDVNPKILDQSEIEGKKVYAGGMLEADDLVTMKPTFLSEYKYLEEALADYKDTFSEYDKNKNRLRMEYVGGRDDEYTGATNYFPHFNSKYQVILSPEPVEDVRFFDPSEEPDYRDWS